MFIRYYTYALTPHLIGYFSGLSLDFLDLFSFFTETSSNKFECLVISMQNNICSATLSPYVDHL